MTSAPELSQSEFATLKDLMTRRRSCRAFKPDPVPREVIDAILEAAQSTASWCNSQPWRVVVTSGAGTERLRAALYEASAGAPEATDNPVAEGVPQRVQAAAQGERVPAVQRAGDRPFR
ncbi:nitroreductase [Mycolicibacterium phlei RIVM601174]|nr:nitroreductase [Mycolicibacterium phlei RIVM601174]